MAEGYEVYVVADAVGGTSKEAHKAALRRIEQAGGKLISKTQLYCELQRDWNRAETVPGFMHVFENFDGSNPEKDFKQSDVSSHMNFKNNQSESHQHLKS